MVMSLSLSEAKARLSELVRAARARGEDTVITVDGEPAARLVPLETAPRSLTAAEVAGYRALVAGLTRIPRPDEPFDAVDLVREGRR